MGDEDRIHLSLHQGRGSRRGRWFSVQSWLAEGHSFSEYRREPRLRSATGSSSSSKCTLSAIERGILDAGEENRIFDGIGPTPRKAVLLSLSCEILAPPSNKFLNPMILRLLIEAEPPSIYFYFNLFCKYYTLYCYIVIRYQTQIKYTLSHTIIHSLAPVS